MIRKMLSRERAARPRQAAAARRRPRPTRSPSTVAGPAQPGQPDAVGHRRQHRLPDHPLRRRRRGRAGPLHPPARGRGHAARVLRRAVGRPASRPEPTDDGGAGRRWRPAQVLGRTSTTAPASRASPRTTADRPAGAGLRRRRSTGNADTTEYTATEIRYAAGDEALATPWPASIPGATTAESDERHQRHRRPGPRLGLQRRRPGGHRRRRRPSRSQGEDARTAADTELHQLTGVARWARACSTSPCPPDLLDRRPPPRRGRAAGHLLRRRDRRAGRAVGDDAGQLGRQDGEPAAGRVRRRPGQHGRGGPAGALADRGGAARASGAAARPCSTPPPRTTAGSPASTSSWPRRTGWPPLEEDGRGDAELLGLSLHPLGAGHDRLRRAGPRLRARGARPHGDRFVPVRSRRTRPARGCVARRAGADPRRPGRGRRRAGRPARDRPPATGSWSTSRSPPRPGRWPGCWRRWPPAPRSCSCRYAVAERLARPRGRRAGHRDPRAPDRRRPRAGRGRE